MAVPGFYNENSQRDYPFLARTSPLAIVGPQLPRECVVDCGFLMGARSGFLDGSDSVYLAEIRRAGSQLTFVLRTTAPGASVQDLLFTRSSADTEFLADWVESVPTTADQPFYSFTVVAEDFTTGRLLPWILNDALLLLVQMVGGFELQLSTDYVLDRAARRMRLLSAIAVPIGSTVEVFRLSDPGGDPTGCAESSWRGFLVTGRLAGLADSLGDPEVRQFPAELWVVEPARVQNLAGTYVRSINLANKSRTLATPAAGCGDESHESQFYVQSRCLQGPLQVKAGYNTHIRQDDVRNALIFSGAVGSGVGEACEELPLYPGEIPPPGSRHLSGGLSCNELLTTINGVGGPGVRLIPGRGVDIDADPANPHGLRIRIRAAEFTSCLIDTGGGA